MADKDYLAAMIEKATELFARGNVTKHLILLTDALPTIGKKPEEEALKYIAIAAAGGITVSIIGINLDSKGKELAQQMVDVGGGRLFAVKGSDQIDRLIIEDYEALR